VLHIQKASAGSGKTFALTRQYLTLLLGRRDSAGRNRLYGKGDYGFRKPKAHGRILAITFTNKATQEMTDRIIKELSILAKITDDKSAHLDYLKEVYSATDEEVAQAAYRALSDLLFNFSSFNVSTIDSFFQNILRIFTRELDLPENFDLEVQDNYPIAVAIGEMLNSLNVPERGFNEDNRLRRARLEYWLNRYMESLIDEGQKANLLSRSSKLNKELIRMISSLRGETFKTHSKAIMDYISDPDRVSRFLVSFNTHLDVARAKLKLHAIQLKNGAEYDAVKSTLKANYIERWAVGDFSYSPYPKGKEPRVTIINAAVPADETDGKHPRRVKLKKGLAWSDAYDVHLVDTLQFAIEYFKECMLNEILYRQMYLLGLFSEACQYIDEYCREHEAFLLGDTTSLLCKVICDEETPFVYERIGTTINHFLIDEFQDTSVMQWDNLRPLVAESMSRGNDNLIIGDVKQCIYRFRNSSPELLGSTVENDFRGTFGRDNVEIKGVNIADNTNWRSSRTVVMFNNTLFAALARAIDGKTSEDMPDGLATTAYSGLIQQVAPKNQNFDGYVKVIFGPGTDDEGDGDGDASEVQAEASDEAGIADVQTGYTKWTDEDILRHLVEEIDRELSSGYQPKDIAILVRKHTQGEKVISCLLEEMTKPEWKHGHIDIVSSDAMEISASPAVQLIVGILRIITTPQYIIDLNKGMDEEGRPVMKPNPDFLRNRLIHRYELCVFDEKDDVDENGNPIRRRLTPDEALMKAVAATEPLPGEYNPDETQTSIDAETARPEDADCPSLFAITERIIQKYVPQKSRVEDVAFISAFQDLVSEFEAANTSDVDSFLDWWDSRGRRQTLPAPDGMNAISVMTIHQAKGLEFQCVHIPFCSNKMVEYKGEGWYRLDADAFGWCDSDDVPPFIPLVHKASYENVPLLSEQIKEYSQTQMLDNLNVAYVAFTRAVSELIVYAKLGTAKDARTNLSNLLFSSVKQLDDACLAGYRISDDARQWVFPLADYLHDAADGEKELIIGSPTFKQTKVQGDEKAQADLQDAGSLYPADALKDYSGERPRSFDAEMPYETFLSEYRVERPADIILPDDIEHQGVFDINDERHVGNFLHDVLANVRHISDLPLAMERGAYRRNLEEPQWRPYLEKLTAALNMPQVKPWFEDFELLMTERPLTAPEGLRRPDRVVQLPSGEVVVIDYKFGVPRKKYRDQVREYMALLYQCGYTNLTGYLFYPLTQTLLPVD
jgi:ATP-dependent exoDNAse (exonuclease V) beta subunit